MSTGSNQVEKERPFREIHNDQEKFLQATIAAVERRLAEDGFNHINPSKDRQRTVVMSLQYCFMVFHEGKQVSIVDLNNEVVAQVEDFESELVYTLSALFETRPGYVAAPSEVVKEIFHSFHDRKYRLMSGWEQDVRVELAVTA